MCLYSQLQCTLFKFRHMAISHMCRRKCFSSWQNMWTKKNQTKTNRDKGIKTPQNKWELNKVIWHSNSKTLQGHFSLFSVQSLTELKKMSNLHSVTFILIIFCQLVLTSTDFWQIHKFDVFLWLFFPHITEVHTPEQSRSVISHVSF